MAQNLSLVYWPLSAYRYTPSPSIRLGVNPLALPRRSQLPQHADQRRRSRNCDGLAVKLRCRADHVHWHALPSLGPVNNLRNPQRSLRANCLLPD